MNCFDHDHPVTTVLTHSTLLLHDIVVSLNVSQTNNKIFFALSVAFRLSRQ